MLPAGLHMLLENFNSPGQFFYAPNTIHWEPIWEPILPNIYCDACTYAQ